MKIRNKILIYILIPFIIVFYLITTTVINYDKQKKIKKLNEKIRRFMAVRQGSMDGMG